MASVTALGRLACLRSIGPAIGVAWSLPAAAVPLIVPTPKHLTADGDTGLARDPRIGYAPEEARETAATLGAECRRLFNWDCLLRLGEEGAAITLAVRDHALPIWRADFADERGSIYYVSGVTGEILERRTDSWRLWDVFWMLHTMDYAKRTSFNHPLIVLAGFASVWLAVTGFWLLFRTMWRHDFAWTRRGPKWR